MNIQKNQIDDLNLQVTLEIAAEDYAAIEKKKLNERLRNTELKGFRKGKAPMSLIKKLYGEQTLVESVNTVINEQLDKVIKEDDLHVLGEPLASEDQPKNEWESGKDFTFKFDLGLSPKFDFDITEADSLPYYDITVTEVAKKEMKENMLNQLGSMQEGEAAKEEDYVIADFDNGSHKTEGAYVSLRNVAGDARSKFIGCKAGEGFEVNVNEAFENETDRASMLKVKKEELAALDPVFKVTIVNVKTFVPAEANTETFDKLFGEGNVKNDEDFTKAVTERLKANYKEEADYRLSKDIRNYLVEKAAVTLPEDFLKRWLLEANEGKFTKEQIEKDFDAFKQDFKWDLVRSYLMQKYDLKVEDKDVEDAAEGFAAYQYAMYGMGNVPQELIKSAAQNILSDQKQLRRMIENVEDRKVIDAVRPKFKLAHKKISVAKFRELN